MNIVIIIISMICLILLDQITKAWAVAVLIPGGPIKIWENVFHLHYISNYGAAWGIFSGKQIFLILLTSVIIIGMLIYMSKLPQNQFGHRAKIAFILIISGAIGNLIDRIFLGYVRDFIYFAFIDFPIFNIADVLVVVGVAFMIITLFYSEEEISNA